MAVGGVRFRRFRFQLSSPLRCQCFFETPFCFRMGIVPFLHEDGHTLCTLLTAMDHAKRERRHTDQTGDDERGRIGEHDGGAFDGLTCNQREEPEDSRRNTCDRPQSRQPLGDRQEFR